MSVAAQQLQHVRPGEPVRAVQFNALIDAVRALAGANRGGPQMQTVVEARITRVYGNQTEDLIGNVRYDVEAKGGEFTLTNVAPDYGRPFDEADILIRPALRGSRCLVLRFTDDQGEPTYHLWLPFGGKGERLSPSRCGQSGNRMTGLRRVLMAGGGLGVPPAPPGGDGPITGDGGGPIGGGEI